MPFASALPMASPRPSSFILVVHAATALITIGGMGAEAHAGLAIGVDGTGARAVGDGSEHASTGIGLIVRAGYALDVPGLRIVPEVLLGWTTFGMGFPSGWSGEVSFWRAFVGGRVSIGSTLRPFVYWHGGICDTAGYQSRDGDLAEFSADASAGFDAGVGLTWTALPGFEVGIRSGYIQASAGRADVTRNGLRTSVEFYDSTKWIDFGATASFTW